MQIHELDTCFGLGVLKRSGSMVFSLRLAAVGLLGAVTLAPEAALAFNRLPLHPTPVGASVHGAVSAVKPAAIRMRAPRSARGVRMSSEAATEKAWSAAGMTVEDFYSNSIGSWRSLRSSHNIAFAQLEEVNSEIDITNVDQDDAELIQICKTYNVDPKTACSCIRMSWEGTSDWDDEAPPMKGSTVLVVVKDSENKGRLLRSVGYTEEIPAVGDWEMQPDGTFVLHTLYDRAAAEERIWFGTPDLRMRCSIIKTQGGKGVLTASLSTEVTHTHTHKSVLNASLSTEVDLSSSLCKREKERERERNRERLLILSQGSAH
jgi:phycoerythrin-associated linker protein